MERWRLFVALGAALAALPLLAIDTVSSAEGRAPSTDVAVLGTTLTPTDPAIDLLASRASSWVEAREAVREANVSEALRLAAQARKEEAARLAEATRRDEQAKNAEAARRAADAARKAAAEAAARKATTTTKPAPPTTVRTPVASGEPTAEQWRRLRQCESGGNYAALSAGGRFRGAYQFSQSTWDWLAARVAPQLVAVDPIDAAPGDQDNMALNLYRMRGANQWPVCGSYLR